MPELPEVQTVVTELNKKLKGKKIASVLVMAPKLVSIGPATVANKRKNSPSLVKKFSQALTGQKIVSVKRRAKLLIFDFSGPYCLLVHLKMTGQFIFEDKALRAKTKSRYRILNKANAPLVQFPTKHTHVIFKFSDSSILYFNDVRKFGYLKLLKDSDVSKVKELKDFGPEPLGKDFTLNEFIQSAKTKKKLSIKQYLLDPKIVTGIGNIYSDEILFHAKVKPTRLLSSLTLKEWKAIFKQIPIVLKLGIKYKGSSVGDFIRTDGTFGTMGKHHWVYGRYKENCKVCHTPLKRVTLGGRTSSFCSNCQQ